MREAMMALVALLALVALVALAACGVDGAPVPTCAELGAPDTLLCSQDGVCSFEGQACQRITAPTNPLVDRLVLCGPAPAEPIQEPATMTDSIGQTFVVLSPKDWDASASYMDASKAWADCVIDGVPVQR